MSSESKVIMRPVSIIVTSALVIVLATYLGIVARLTWEGFSWGWELFGL